MAIEEDEVDNGVGPGTVLLLGFIFLPAAVVAGGFYLLLRKWHLRLSSVFQIFLGFELFLLLLWWGSSSTDRFKNLASHPTEIGSHWTELVLPLLIFYAAVGGVLGLLIVWWEIRQMKQNPHRLELVGSWQYQFQFRRGLGQVLARKKRLEGLKFGRFITEDAASLGLNEEEEDRVVSRYYSEAATHTLLSGASGSGKTVSMQSLIYADIVNKVPCVVLDFKRSPEFASKLAAWAEQNHCNFYHFVNGELADYDIKHSAGPVRYDPLASGSPTAKADMVLGMREYDTASAVYRANMQQLLQVLFSMFYYADRNSPDLQQTEWLRRDGSRIVDLNEFLDSPEVSSVLEDYYARQPGGTRRKDRRVLAKELKLYRERVRSTIRWDEGGLQQLASAVANVSNFAALAKACTGMPIEEDARAVAEGLIGSAKNKGLLHAFEELQGQLRTITASEYGQWMRTTTEDQGVNLMELTSQPGNVILFSLNSDSEPEFARYVGSMILADITNVSARRRNQQLTNQVMVYIDEFQAVNPSTITGLLEKSRESRMAVTLAQQSFEQVVAAAPQNGEAYLLSILDTCSNFLVHNGMTEDSAERLSKILGKHWVTQYRSTNQNQNFFLSVNWRNRRDSMVNTSKEEVWVFPPRKFMTLMSPSKANGFKGTAVLINKSCADPAYVGRPGAVARRLWMVPPEEVLETYYDRDYRLDVGERSTVSVVQASGDSVEFISPQELDLASAFVPQSRPTASPIAPVESSPQPQAPPSPRPRLPEPPVNHHLGREWPQVLSDEPPPIEDEESLAAYRDELRPPRTTEDVVGQWSSAAPPPRRQEANEEPPAALPQPSAAPPPRRGGGLPKAPAGVKKNEEDSGAEDTPLPSL